MLSFQAKPHLKTKSFSKIVLSICLLGVCILMLFKPSTIVGKNLSVLSGTVTGLQSVVEERLVGDPHDVMVKDIKTYTYIAKFTLGSKEITASFKDPYKIAEGDRIEVSGVQKPGVFEVAAYRNYTQNYTGSDSWIVVSLVGLGFLFAALYIYFFQIESPVWYEQLGFSLFCLVGLGVIHRGLFIKEALDLLK